MTPAETEHRLTQMADDIQALVQVMGVFRSEQERAQRDLERAQRDIDRAQLTATFACLYGKRISEHMGINTQDIDDLVRARDEKLARDLGLAPPPEHDPEAETDPFASAPPPKNGG